MTYSVTDIEWDIDMDEVYEKFEGLTVEEASETLDIPTHIYSSMSTAERNDVIRDVFHHAPGKLYDFLMLPEREVFTGSVDEDEVVDYLSDTYGYCINSCKVNSLGITQSQLEENAYEYYKLDWMLQHRHTLKEYFTALKDIAVEFAETDDLNPDISIAFEEIRDTFEDSGFGGELYVCFDEFLGAEYLDKEYMESILPKNLYEEYLKIHIN